MEGQLDIDRRKKNFDLKLCLVRSPPEFLCWDPNLGYLKMGLYLETQPFKKVNRLK